MKRTLLLLFLVIGVSYAQEAAKPDPLALTETEKKDLTIANLTLDNLDKEYRLTVQRLSDLREAYKAQLKARTDLAAVIAAAKGEGVVCDAEKLTCERPKKATFKP